jgi:CRP/FNR family cyclic AMP-dependent transcriptional regulator
VVLHKGGSGDGLLFLLSGQLQVVDITEDGRAIGLRMLAPGDFFGEIALINNSTRSASVVALTDVLVAFLPAPTAMHLFSHSPSVAKQMLQHLAQKIQRDSEFRALLSINNTTKRIYNYLFLMQQEETRWRRPWWKPADPPGYCQHDQHQPRNGDARADHAGAAGYYQKDSHKLIILDREGLEKLMQGAA